MSIDLCKYNLSAFQKALSVMKLDLNEHQLQQFIRYYELLTEWNRVMNLTAITEFDEVCTKHFIDSISLYKVFDDIMKYPDKPCSIMDVGTGAGFPGIPLKIAFPCLQITLLDSLKKRVCFLDEVIYQLKLTGISAIHGRAEDMARNKNFREQYNICVSRAVSRLSTLAEYCLPYVSVGGYFIAYKSEKIVEELDEASRAVKLLGGSLYLQKDFFLPQTEIYRNLVVYRKIKTTSDKYPRKAGIPHKEPL